MRTRTDLWRVRQLGNACNGSTLLGLAVARLGRCRMRLGPRGMFVGEGYRLGFPVASAFTVGNVVITAQDVPALVGRHPDLMLHEEKHAWQWFWLLGLPFLPAYALAMVWSLARTGHRAHANVFEVAAGLTSGGYRRA